jgi:hypothetical protein
VYLLRGASSAASKPTYCGGLPSLADHVEGDVLGVSRRHDTDPLLILADTRLRLQGRREIDGLAGRQHRARDVLGVRARAAGLGGHDLHRAVADVAHLDGAASGLAHAQQPEVENGRLEGERRRAVDRRVRFGRRRR